MADLPDVIAKAIGQQFKPGQIVPESGIYEVTHDAAHTMEHQVTAIKGKPFPPCRSCGHITYRLIAAARHLHDHPAYRHEA